MKTAFAVACLLAGSAAAEVPRDCTIATVRERVMPEQSGGPQRPIEEGEVVSPRTEAGAFQVIIACGPKRYFAVFTSASNFNRSVFNVGSAVRVNVENDEIHIESRAGTRATGRLTADR